MTTKKEQLESGRLSKLVMDYFTLMVAVASLIVAILSAIYSYRLSAQLARMQSVDSVYQLILDLESKILERPFLSHFNCLGPQSKSVGKNGHAEYEAVKTKVGASVGPLDEKTRAAYLLQERDFAEMTINYFDRTYYEIQEGGHEAWLDTVDRYLTEDLLRNPRILYYWDQLHDNYEADVQEAFYNKVLSKEDVQKYMDKDGPFAPK